MNKNQDLFRSYFSSLKQSIFNVSFKVLENKGQSLQTTILLSLIQFFQLIYFPFQIQVSFAWHNQYISKQIQKSLQYFTLMRLVIYQDFYIYLIGMYIAVAAVYFIATVVFIGTFLKFLQQQKIIIEILSLVLRFTITFGFIEITRILLGFLICKKDYKGDYRMLYCPQQICWESTYIIHAVVVIITLLIFFVITFISIQLLIDIRKNDKNSFSQKEGNSYSFIFVYSTLSLLFYSLLEHPKYTFIQIFIQNTTSLIVFIKIHYNRPFYNQIIQRIWSIISGLVFYTNFMHLITFCFEHTVMEDTLICWIVTAPLLLVILFKNQINEIDILKANMIQQLSSNEIIEKCQFLIDLILHHEKDQKKQIYLTGYLEVHKQVCQNPNCAIKVNKSLSKKFKGNPKYQEKKYILTELISQIFQDGIQRYPTSIQLKIHYSYYLFDFLEQGQKALIELEKAENLNPTFGEEFLIFKMKKTIEDYFFKSTLDVENINHILNFDRSMKYQFEQLKQSLQELAFNKLIFWNILLEETPNITLLNKYGNLILNQNQLIKMQLKQRCLNNHFDTQTESLIKKFSKLVQNIDEQDLLYLKKIQQVFVNQEDHQFLNNQENLGNYSQPVLLIEIFGKNDQQALIRNLNAAFHSLVGYSKTDLIGKPASNVIQLNYFQLLSVFIESYFSLQLQEKLLEVQERQIFLIHKSKFIIHTYVKSSIFATEKGVFQFSRFRLDQIFHQVGYIIFQQDGKIEGLTSSCISLLNINSQYLFLLKQLFIQRLFPYLLQNKEHYFNRLSPIEYDYNKNLFINHSNDYDDENQDENQKYYLLGQLFEITAKQYSITVFDGKQQFFGYFLKIENNELNNMQSIPILKKNKVLNQFKYHLDQKTYIFEYGSQQTSQNESVRCDSDLQEEPKACIITCQSFPSKKTIVNPKQQLLGNDIRTFRLFQGEIKEVIQEDDDEYSQIEERSKQQQQQQLNDEKDIISIHFNSQNDLNYYLQSISYPKIFKRSTLILSLLLLGLFLIAVLMYIYINQSLDEIQVSIALLTLNNQRLASIFKIQSNIQDLRGCNLKIEPYTMGVTGGRFITINFVEFSTELDILIKTNLLIVEKSLHISKHLHTESYDIKQQNVPMYTLDDKYQNYTYSEAMSQLIAKAISLNNTNVTQFIDQNEDLHYYLHNSFNSIPTYSHISQFYYYYYIQDLIQGLDGLLDNFLIISTLNIILIILAIYAIYYYHKQHIKQTISILLYISKKNINKLISNIQLFIQLLQNIDEENLIESEQEDELLEEKDINDRNKRHKQKKMQFRLQGSNRLLIQFGCYFSLIYTYICYIYFSSNLIISQTNQLVPLINLTSFIPSQYSLIDNSIKEMLYDENSILYNKMNTIDNIMIVLNDLQELDAQLHKLNQENLGILSDEYLSLFDSLYIQDPCEIIISNDVSVNVTACETFNKNILQEGLAVAITYFFENAQLILKYYSVYNESQDYSQMQYNLSSNHRDNYTYNLLNTRIGNANRKMQKVFIRICHMVLVQSLENFVNNYFNNLTFNSTLLFLAFCILYLATYFFFIIPLQVRFYLENQKVKEILTLIPIEFYNIDENLQILLRDLKDSK